MWGWGQEEGCDLAHRLGRGNVTAIRPQVLLVEGDQVLQSLIWNMLSYSGQVIVAGEGKVARSKEGGEVEWQEQEVAGGSISCLLAEGETLWCAGAGCQVLHLDWRAPPGSCTLSSPKEQGTGWLDAALLLHKGEVSVASLESGGLVRLWDPRNLATDRGQIRCDLCGDKVAWLGALEQHVMKTHDYSCPPGWQHPSV